VDVDVADAERRGGGQLLRQQLDRLLVEARLGAGQVDQVRRVRHDGLDTGGGQPLAERGQLRRRRCAAGPRRRVVGEDLERGRADLGGPVRGLDHAGAEGQVGAEASTVGEHPRHRTMPAMEDEREDPAFEAKVLRAFIRDGRLVSIPSKERRRQVVYRYLRDQVFVEERSYPEKEVNQRLALFHPDVATIRRGMVDARLVSRENGEYWRGPR
jgi:hypothetical protein